MTTLYEKRGRRYVPVHDTAAIDGLPDGTWNVQVKGGQRIAIRECDVTSAFSACCAIPSLADIICEAILEASAWHPQSGSRPLSDQERQAWAAWEAVMGADGTIAIERDSAQDVAVKVARRILELADRTSHADRENVTGMTEFREPLKKQNVICFPDNDNDDDWEEIDPC